MYRPLCSASHIAHTEIASGRLRETVAAWHDGTSRSSYYNPSQWIECYGVRQRLYTRNVCKLVQFGPSWLGCEDDVFSSA